MVYTKLKHLMYRSRELMIPVGMTCSYVEVDRREEELVKGFREMLDIFDK
jgi:hypothetical protein